MISSKSKNLAEHRDELKDLVQACIHCGICLPACPTYAVTGNEGNSPRGRVYLINDLLESRKLNGTKQSVDYLDNCLSCAACETVCPSGVDYTNILELARNEYKQSFYTHGFSALIRKIFFEYVLPRRYLLNWMRVLMRFSSWLINPRIFIKSTPRLNFHYREIQTNHYYKSSIEFSELEDKDRTLSLPLGCVMDTFYNHVHWDTITVLNAFGYHVYIPDAACCGALAFHSGETDIGETQLNTLANVIVEKTYPLILNSAGCGAFLKEHSHLKILDLIEALERAPYNPMKEDFLKANLDQPSRSSHKRITVSYHPACHLNHKQNLSAKYLDLLRQIPNLEIQEIFEADMCCGSAGFYNLIKPKLAAEIGKRKANNIKMNDTNIVVSANPGCIAQIQGHLGNKYQVFHPVTILRGYLKTR